MASAADLRALEAEVPWDRPDFRAGLADLQESVSVAAQRWAADLRTLARVAALVPRCPNDERGGTPWTSFCREVAVARSCSDVAAASEIRAALLVTRSMPRTLALLDAGAVTVQRARAFVTEVECYDESLATALDDQLAERVARTQPWRIVLEVRRLAARLEPDAAAIRTATKNAGRGVSLSAEADDQARIEITGPAVPSTRWYATLDARARAAKQAGDPRTLDQLRFDLATSSFPCSTHVPADNTGSAAPSAAGARASTAATAPAAQAAPANPAPAGLRPSFVEAADSDCRMSRPVQANIGFPVESALGLSNDPAWLDGYGWISAPTARQLLIDAELRRICTQAGTGALVDVADRDVRPPPTPIGVRHALLDMVCSDVTVSSTAWRVEDQHDPTPPLSELVALRDRFCDGPTGTRRAARTRDLDHDIPHPHGPTAAWNLVARSQRTHQLKHYGWVPLRTPTSTFWFSPAGQVVETPHHDLPSPGFDLELDEPPLLPDPELLDLVDRAQLQPPHEADQRPWTHTDPAARRSVASWFDGSMTSANTGADVACPF